MNDPALAARLDGIFAEELGLDPADIGDSLHYNLTPEWDSVGHMHLIAAIEEAFSLSIPDDDVVEMTSYPQVVAIVTRLVGGSVP